MDIDEWYGPKEDQSGVIRATISHHMNLEHSQVRTIRTAAVRSAARN